MTSELEKPVTAPRRSRLAFLKTKRAIALLSLLVVTSVVLIALGATHVLTPQSHTSVTNHNNNVGGSLGSTNGDNNTGSSNGNNGGDSGTSAGSSSGSSGGGNASNNTDSSDDSSGNGSDEGSGDDNKGDDGDSNEDTPGGSANNSTSGGDNGSPRGGSNNDGKGTGTGKGGATKNPDTWRPSNSSSIADGTPLRIMCLGASIVKGETSPDSNGFRKTLRAELSGLGAPINMVGSQRYGDMPDNDFEAYGGNRVSQIHDHATHIVPETLPNVFVINVGTNNALQRKDVDVAGKHMEAFIDYLLGTSPRSTVVLSTLLTNTVPNREPLILNINQQFRNLFHKKYEKKKPVVLAELHPSEGLPGRPQVGDIGPDGSHPLEQGYQIMGHLLAEAVKEADQKGYLRWPENGEPYDGEIGRINATDASATEASPAERT